MENSAGGRKPRTGPEESPVGRGAVDGLRAKSYGQGSGAGVSRGATREDNPRIDEYIVGLVNGSLAQSLPLDVALAVRMCVSTRAVLNDPEAYVAVLKGIVGRNSATAVVARAEEMLRRLNFEPVPTGLDLPGMILDLRSRYSSEAMEKWK